MNTQERSEEGKNQPDAGIIGILRYMANHADDPQGAQMPGGGKLRVSHKNVTLYSGANDVTFEKLANALTVLLGEPIEHETSTIPNSNEVEAQKFKFPGDVDIVFMAFRDNGISINIPKQTLPLLSEKLAQYEIRPGGGKAETVPNARTGQSAPPR